MEVLPNDKFICTECGTKLDLEDMFFYTGICIHCAKEIPTKNKTP